MNEFQPIIGNLTLKLAPIATHVSILLCNFLLVVPTKVQIDNFFKNDDKVGCNETRRVQWHEINTGNCSVQYTIEFRNTTDGITGTENNISGNFYCTNQYDSATSVIMFATYNDGTRGNRSEVKFLTATPEPSTTTVTSPTTKQKGTKHFDLCMIYVCM